MLLWSTAGLDGGMLLPHANEKHQCGRQWHGPQSEVTSVWQNACDGLPGVESHPRSCASAAGCIKCLSLLRLVLPPPPKKKTFLVFKLPQCLLLWQKPLHFLFMSLVCICLEQMHTQTKTFAGSDYGNQWSKSGSTPIYKKQPDNHPSNYTAQASTLLRLTFFFSLI